MNVIRKDDLIAMLQALPGNPVVVVEHDGGDYWGNYFEFPTLKVKTVHTSEWVGNQVHVGHPKPSANQDGGYVDLDETRTYVVIE